MLNKATASKINIAGKDISLETGVMAKQANGSVTIKCGETILLATVVMSKKPRENIDFFPLVIEYSEKMYSAGKVPGGFFKREARPSITATLTARLIDRPLRPSFPKGFSNDVQIVITVLSYDPSFPPDFLSIIGASAAVSISDIPFNGPVGAATVARVNGQFVGNPTNEELGNSDLNIVVAGTKEAILMVEGDSKEISEADAVEAIKFAHKHIKTSIELQEELISKAGKEKLPAPVLTENQDLEDKINKFLGNKIESELAKGKKQDSEQLLAELEEAAVAEFASEEEDNAELVKSIYNKLKKDKIRKTIITNKIRPDGRALDEIRPIEIDLGLLPSAHGSALFTRGETQSLGTVTLGSSDDQQMVDGLDPTHKKSYYFHYNFPPFSVGEVGRFGTGRRELGHGSLAERALRTIIPDSSGFPYTIRIVSEILESNGSSSMASVCSGALALMDCGVPISAPVSGIAMGLLIEGDEFTILSDIQGLEDHYGDMDFKVAGTANGITALQLDMKVSGISYEIVQKALDQAKVGRLHILSTMTNVIKEPRAEVSENAPKIELITIDPEKVGTIIGPGGKTIRNIEEETGASVIVTDGTNGEVSISAKNKETLDKAKNWILSLVKEIEVGEVYDGKVVRITTFGAFVELVPGKDGLLHISAISKERINKVEDVLSVGEIISVRVKDIDKQNRVSLERGN
ncbi:polyribonucleotide nucleotidyltransferase [Candidatus Margulisiibacteriota bacterium]